MTGHVRITKVIFGVHLLVFAIAMAWMFGVPLAIEHEVRTRLDGAGYHDARFEVGRVALDRVELLDVRLREGLELGDVEIGAGPLQLWRGARPDVAVRHPKIDVEAVKTTAGPPGKAPFRRVVVDGGVVRRNDKQIGVRGTIDLSGPQPALDLVAQTKSVALGEVVLEDVAMTVRGRIDRLRACGTGHVGSAQVDACVVRDPEARDRAKLEWAARETGGSWTAKGSGRLVAANNTVALADGKLALSVKRRSVGELDLEAATVHADVAGDLKSRTFSARGQLAANGLAMMTKVALRDVTMPFEVTGTLDKLVRLRSARELVLSAKTATVTTPGGPLRVEAPVILARGTTTFVDRIELTSGAPARGLDLVANVRGVPLDRVVAFATRNRVRATGVLDGVVRFRFDDGALAVGPGKLAARTPGRLRTSAVDPKAKTDAFAVHERVAQALADFDYSRLALTINNEPNVHLSVSGRGRRVRQALNIDVNVRGLFAALERKR